MCQALCPGPHKRICFLSFPSEAATTITPIFQIKKTEFQEFANGHKVAGSGFEPRPPWLKAYTTAFIENMEYKLEEWGIVGGIPGQGPRAKRRGLDACGGQRQVGQPGWGGAGGAGGSKSKAAG